MDESHNDMVVTRLCALWALTEVSLGGLLHALRIPLTGLMVGTAAIACMYLIARSSRSYQTVLKSLMIVAAIKFAATPHASPFAYLAMCFQALFVLPLAGKMGEKRGWVVLFFMLAAFYSPTQKLALIYVAVGSEGLATVAASMHEWLNPPVSIGGFVIIPVILWFTVHVAFGYISGRWLHRWLGNSHRRHHLYDEWQCAQVDDLTLPIAAKRWYSGRMLSILSILVLALLYVYEDQIPTWMHYLWRPLLIIVIWQTVVKPVVQYANASILERSTKKGAVGQVMSEMPRMWSILSFAREKSEHLPGIFSRVRNFLHITMTLAVVHQAGGPNG